MKSVSNLSIEDAARILTDALTRAKAMEGTERFLWSAQNGSVNVLGRILRALLKGSGHRPNAVLRSCLDYGFIAKGEKRNNPFTKAVERGRKRYRVVQITPLLKGTPEFKRIPEPVGAPPVVLYVPVNVTTRTVDYVKFINRSMGRFRKIEPAISLQEVLTVALQEGLQEGSKSSDSSGDSPDTPVSETPIEALIEVSAGDSNDQMNAGAPFTEALTPIDQTAPLLLELLNQVVARIPANARRATDREYLAWYTADGGIKIDGRIVDSFLMSPGLQVKPKSVYERWAGAGWLRPPFHPGGNVKRTAKPFGQQIKVIEFLPAALLKFVPGTQIPKPDAPQQRTFEEQQDNGTPTNVPVPARPPLLEFRPPRNAVTIPVSGTLLLHLRQVAGDRNGAMPETDLILCAHKALYRGLIRLYDERQT